MSPKIVIMLCTTFFFLGATSFRGVHFGEKDAHFTEEIVEVVGEYFENYNGNRPFESGFLVRGDQGLKILPDNVVSRIAGTPTPKYLTVVTYDDGKMSASPFKLLK